MKTYVCLLCSLLVVCGAKAKSEFDLESSSGGHGTDSLYSTDNGDSLSPIYQGGGGLHFDIRGRNGDRWHVDFVAPDGGQLSVGDYQGSYPIEGNGHGDSHGSFHVYQVAYDNYGYVTSAAVDFQYDGNHDDRHDHGSIRYNSDYPMPSVPEPSTYALFGVAGVIAFLARKSFRPA